jgi:hypothetical protein
MKKPGVSWNAGHLQALRSLAGWTDTRAQNA